MICILRCSGVPMSQNEALIRVNAFFGAWSSENLVENAAYIHTINTNAQDQI